MNTVEHFFAVVLAAIGPDTLATPSATPALSPWPVIVLTLFFLALLATSLLSWCALLVARVNGVPLPIKHEAAAPAPWGFLDVLFAIFVWVAAQIIAPVILTLFGYRGALLTEPTPLWIVAVIQSFALISVILTSGWLLAWFGQRARWVGWSLRRIGYDILLGIAAFVVTAPITYTLMAVATTLTKKDYDHPLFAAFGKDPINVVYAAWIAVVLAPIIEEFLFRVLLQGFLQSMAEGKKFSAAILFLGRGRVESPTPIELTSTSENVLELSAQIARVDALPPEKPSWILQELGGKTTASMNPYEMPSINQDEATNFNIDQTTKANSNWSETQIQRPWWPVLLSGTLFGLAHFEYGVSWIPLIFFGIVLGWLYRVTNRIWPSLIVHMISNAIAITGFTIQTFFGDGKGL